MNKTTYHILVEEDKMSQVYKEKIIKALDDIPSNMLPKVYKMIHLLKKEFPVVPLEGDSKRRSLKGIWKGCEIDDSLFEDAKKSIFKYENSF